MGTRHHFPRGDRRLSASGEVAAAAGDLIFKDAAGECGKRMHGWRRKSPRHTQT